MKKNLTAIVILNWNNWPDTNSCLESLLRLSNDNIKIIVCDNGSTDGSLEKIEEWISTRAHSDWSSITPALGTKGNLVPCEFSGVPDNLDDHQIFLLKNGRNLGFGGGNNPGLFFGFNFLDAEFCWLLNNDTAPDANSLRYLIEEYRTNEGKSLVGSVLTDAEGHFVQAVGGNVNIRFSRTTHKGEGLPLENLVKMDDGYFRSIDYLVGASILISKYQIERIGYLSELYFLYYEDVDYSFRAKQVGFSISVARKSIVRHKEGGTIGSSSKSSGKSLTADYYGNRNKIIFARSHNPDFILTTKFGIIISSFIRLARLEFKRFFLLLKIALLE